MITLSLPAMLTVLSTLCAIRNRDYVRRISVAIGFCFLVNLSLAAEPEALYAEANTAYEQGNFQRAQELYGELIAQRQYSANVFYNHGNALHRAGDNGAAILNYERALWIEPSHPEARTNLAFLREKTGAFTPRKHWTEFVLLDLGLDGYTVLAACAAWAFIFSLSVMVLFRGRFQRMWLIAGASLLLLIYAWPGIRKAGLERQTGIVTAGPTPARFAPASNSAVAGTLTTGSRVRVLSERGGWTYVLLPNGERGWVPATAVSTIWMDA